MLSQEMGVRPSDVVALEDPYERFCFDEAVMVFGSYIRKQLDKVESGGGKQNRKRKELEGKRTLVLKKLLDPNTEEAKTYATPVAGIR